MKSISITVAPLMSITASGRRVGQLDYDRQHDEFLQR